MSSGDTANEGFSLGVARKQGGAGVGGASARRAGTGRATSGSGLGAARRGRRPHHLHGASTRRHTQPPCVRRLRQYVR